MYIRLSRPASSLESDLGHSPHLGCDGVASVSRIDKIIGLFCKRAL